MKKNKRILLSILVLAVIGIVFILTNNKTEPTNLDIARDIFDNNYRDFVSSMEKVTTYNAGDAFFLMNTDDIKEIKTLKNHENTQVGDLYVWHDYGSDDATQELIDCMQIKRILDLDEISQIDREKNAIKYRGRKPPHTNNNEEVWGIYYSLIQNPLADFYFDDVDLKKSGEGWELLLNDGQSYYTEKISGNFYYYEALLLP